MHVLAAEHRSQGDTSNTSSDNSSNTIIPIVVGTVASLLFIVAVFAVLYWQRKRADKGVTARPIMHSFDNRLYSDGSELPTPSGANNAAFIGSAEAPYPVAMPTASAFLNDTALEASIAQHKAKLVEEPEYEKVNNSMYPGQANFYAVEPQQENDYLTAVDSVSPVGAAEPQHHDNEYATVPGQHYESVNDLKVKLPPLGSFQESGV